MARRVIPPSMKMLYDQWHFAPAVVDGRHVRCSGVLGFGADGKIAADPEAQFTQAFENLQVVLTEAGASLADVIEMTTFHVELSKHLGAFTKVKDRFVGDPYPAWTAIGTPELALPGALVEIRVTAVQPD